MPGLDQGFSCCGGEETRKRPTSIDTTPEQRLCYSYGISMLLSVDISQALSLRLITLRNDKLGIRRAYSESTL
jgi:hypothetical protein